MFFDSKNQIVFLSFFFDFDLKAFHCSSVISKMTPYKFGHQVSGKKVRNEDKF